MGCPWLFLYTLLDWPFVFLHKKRSRRFLQVLLDLFCMCRSDRFLAIVSVEDLEDFEARARGVWDCIKRV